MRESVPASVPASRAFNSPSSNFLFLQLEKKEISWERYVDLSASDLGELVRAPKLGKQIHRMIHSVPRVELAAHVQPITRSLLRVDLTVTPDFAFDVKVRRRAVNKRHVDNNV